MNQPGIRGSEPQDLLAVGSCQDQNFVDQWLSAGRRSSVHLPGSHCRQWVFRESSNRASSALWSPPFRQTLVAPQGWDTLSGAGRLFERQSPSGAAESPFGGLWGSRTSCHAASCSSRTIEPQRKPASSRATATTALWVFPNDKVRCLNRLCSRCWAFQD